MTIDFTHDYSDHVLLDSRNKYTELYALSPTSAENVHRGDILLLKTACGRYGLFIAVSSPSEDGTLHLSKYLETDFIKMEGEEF